MLRGKRAWVARYTLMYLCVMAPVWFCLWRFGASLLWGNDALLQQYTTLRYVHDALRGLFAGRGFEMVNLSLGQGFDAIGTLAYYGLTDPTQWPVALFSGAGIEFYYHFLIFFYIYASGLLFGIYARVVKLVRGDDSWLTALAALLFATCGYQTIGVIRNPYYAAGSIYLLLLLIAAERALRGRGWRMMSLCVALMVFANFYLAYQTSLLAALYCLVRLIARARERGLRASLADAGRLLGGYLLGLMLSAVVLLPAAYSFLGSGRTAAASGYTESLLHYPWAYYFKLAALFAVPYDFAGYWALQSFSPLALFGVAYLFGRGGARLDERRAMRAQLRAGLLILLVCLCVPLAGKIFNGGGYATNRWSYGWAAVVCMAAACALPELVEPGWNGRRRLALVGALAGLLALAHGLVASRLPGMSGSGDLSRGAGFGFDSNLVAGLVGAASLFAASGALLWIERRLRRGARGASRLLALLGAACCAVYTVGYGWTAAFGGEFAPAGIEATIAADPAAVSAQLPDEGFYRVDTGFTIDNWADALDYRGTSYYWSLIPGCVSDTYAGLEMPSLRWQFRFYGLDSDSYLCALAGVRYALRAQGEYAEPLPCGFEEIDVPGDVRVYENPCPLPLGYAFYEVMPEAEYEALDPVRRREALISAAVLGEGGEGLERFDGELPCEALEWRLLSSDGIELSDGALWGKAQATLELGFDAPPDSEVYLRLTGTRASGAANETSFSIATQSEAGTGGMYFIRPDGMFNFDQKGACQRLGWSEAGMKSCALRLMTEGELQFSELQLLSAPAQFYRDAVERLSENGWEPRVGANRIEGEMNMAREGILQVAVPYSEGWSATVDGEPERVLRCGGMYTGLRLSAGTHEIKLRYVTPGLLPGALLTLAGWACILLPLGAGWACSRIPSGFKRRSRQGRQPPPFGV